MIPLVPLLAGLGVGFSLIIAIGAQNLYVLRQGMRREHVLIVIAICALSDALLIAVGVSGIGAALQHVPWLVIVVRWAGAAFLVTYGVLAARRAWSGEGGLVDASESPAPVDGTTDAATDDTTDAATDAAGTGAGTTALPAPSGVKTATRAPSAPRVSASVTAVVTTTIALTWLNPHVYLDTLFLLGSVANSYTDERWWFAAGAMAASVIWFSALGIGARHLGRVLRSPRAWRILDGVIAAVMIVLGVMLVLPF
ncbi:MULTISPECIES: LysE/ArgO family amino acid transporter [unclassified Leifsonia]|uniref:LysE/ArgO family amino acid transporter n=1 Tax=unclassified Leifsonia TaxID=2663824 RepID=UPI0006F5F52C|nr:MULTISPECIES: LysE/ArgO family amino acid transporter [unclassified Leifsonia]KQX05405.1 amino acid transporter [Leifsonia sp. Root1293]KRA09038.1 amino acid transporter [Leifsonia sp. Root60]